MKKRILNTGDRFGILTVVKELEPRFLASGAKCFTYLCRCDCGNEKEANSHYLICGDTTSCGCRKGCPTHRQSYKNTTPTYSSWVNMISRCEDKNRKVYQYYGGRGITVCEQWRNSFEQFLKDVGERPDGKSLDRIDNNIGYKPGNVRWASHTEQMRNRSCVHKLTLKGVTKTLPEWAEELGVKTGTLLSRKKYGWSDERILTEKILVRNRQY